MGDEVVSRESRGDRKARCIFIGEEDDLMENSFAGNIGLHKKKQRHNDVHNKVI